MTQPFDGETLVKDDVSRLKTQLYRVFEVMINAGWMTPEELEQKTGYRWASISARLRDLRKKKHGAWKVDRKKVPGSPGLFMYKLSSPFLSST